MLNKANLYKRNMWAIVFALLLMVAMAQTASAQTNLKQKLIDNWFTNTDFENSFTDWTPTVLSGVGTGAIVITTDQAASGTHSVNISCNTPGNCVMTYTLYNTLWYNTANNTYKLSLKYMGNISSGGKLHMYTPDSGGGSVLSSPDVPVGNYTTWQYLNWTPTLNPALSGKTLTFGVQVQTNLNWTVYIDDFVLAVNQQELQFKNGTQGQFGSTNTTYRITLPDNFDETTQHPMYISLHGATGSASYGDTLNNQYVVLSINDHPQIWYNASANHNDTYWWGDQINGTNYTEKMVMNLTRAIITNNTASINPNQVYGYGTSMGGAILRIATKNPTVFKGVQLNVPLFNYSDAPWYSLRSGAMDWVFGTPSGNANYDQANAIYLIQSGYTKIPVRVVYGASDTTVVPTNQTLALSPLYYSNSSYFEMTSIYNGVHNGFDNKTYMGNYFDMLRSKNNDLSNTPYIEVLNATSDVGRYNITNSTTNFTFELLTTSAANLIVRPYNMVHNGKVFNSSQLNITNQISPTNTTLYFNLSANTQVNISQLNIAITPTTDYVNITIGAWNTAGEHHKAFTVSSNTPINPTTLVIGDFPPNKIITIYVDGIESAQTNSNDGGYMSFTYVGLYSAHKFDVLIQGIASNPETAAQLNILVGLIKIAVFIAIIYILLNYFIFKSSQKTSMDKESLITKIVVLTLASIFALIIVLALGSMTGF